MSVSHRSRLIQASLSAGLFLCLPAWASPAGDCLRSQLVVHADSGIELGRLSSEIASRRSRVPEFQFIREEAERRGLRVWLFGGTAASYSHYVKWDLQR